MQITGQILKSRRSKLGFTLDDMTFYVGLSPSTICNLENNFGKIYNLKNYDQTIERLEIVRLEQLIEEYLEHAANHVAKSLVQRSSRLRLGGGDSDS